MDLLLFSFNARGLRDIVKRKAVFLFCKDLRSDFIFIQETHTCSADGQFWKSQWGNDIWLAHGSSHSGGVAILRNTFKGKMILSKSDVAGHWASLLTELEGRECLMCNVYGYNNNTTNNFFIDDIENQIQRILDKHPSANLIIGGDFNCTLDDGIDRWTPKSITAMNQMKSLCQRFDLVDIWRVKHPDTKQFTWSNKTHSLQSRIDYWLISLNEMQNIVKEVAISPSILSDHKIIQLDMKSEDGSEKRGNWYWKFNNNLLKQDEFTMTIQNPIDNHWEEALKNN